MTGVEFTLTPDSYDVLRPRLREVMEYKKKSQPLAASSAGCCFKNPTLPHDLPGIGAAGQRISAGLLIDRAGLKGLTHRSASVSPVHGNFLTTEKGGAARDVIELMAVVQRRVREAFGVDLQREVVVWSRREP